MSSRVSSTHYGSLITEATNTIIDETDGKEVIRLSSVGQLDLPDLEEHFMDIDNNSVKVVGMLMLGSALPYNRPSSSNKAKDKAIIATPTERIASAWPVQVLQPLLLSELRNTRSAGGDENISSVEDSWLIKLPQIELDRALKLSKDHLKSIIEQFLIIWYTHNEFVKRIEEAKRSLILEELEASSAGPRSIQEVRRERQKLATTAADDGMDTVLDVTSASSSAKLSQSGEGEEDQQHLHQQHHHVTFNIQNIIRKERLNHSLGLTTIWVCRWQDKIRWGMHHIPYITMLSNLLPKETILTSPSLYFNNSLPYLRIAVNHIKKLDWQPSHAHPRHHPLIPVKVTIQSLSSNRTINLSIQTLTNQFSTIKNISNQDNQVILSRLANVGFLWLGKVRHNQLQLQPKESIELDFLAEIVSPGVHNLNR